MPAIQFPAAVSATHREAIDEVFRSLVGELGPRIRGLLLTGSATGEGASAQSDIDLFALTDEAWWQRRRFQTCGKDIDLFTVLRMKDAPKIETFIVKSSEKATGIGELGTPPIAPAIGNAIFKATGKRVRRLPFSEGMA